MAKIKSRTGITLHKHTCAMQRREKTRYGRHKCDLWYWRFKMTVNEVPHARDWLLVAGAIENNIKLPALCTSINPSTAVRNVPQHDRVQPRQRKAQQRSR